jgi:hypothetical protein
MNCVNDDDVKVYFYSINNVYYWCLELNIMYLL